MHAYLREDGRYDVFDVEPKIVTAEEYATMQKLDELKAQEKALLVSRTNIDAELAKVTEAIAVLSKKSTGPVDTKAAIFATAPAAGSASEAPVRRKW